MSQSAYALIGLTAIVAALVSVVVFAMLRFMAAARDVKGHLREGGGETVFMAAALQDAMTTLRAQERAMAERAEASEHLSADIVSSLTAGLLVVDRDGQVRTLNPAGQRLLGVPPAPSYGAYRTVLAGAAPLADVIDECLRTGQPIVRRAVELPGSTSGVLHLGVTVSPHAGREGDGRAAICLFSDLTAIIDMEEQLRLKDSLARVGELTAGIAHEFRNGLATIHGYARLLALDSLPEAYRPYVAGIRAETEALGQVVTNFLTFARPAELTLGPVDLEAVVDRAAEDARAEARARGGEVVVGGVFPVVEGDEVLLRQAFSNLLRNALEACQEAGVAPAIAIEGVVDGEPAVARIAVSDNGPGIEPAARERVFRPFFTTRTQGTGLGLALVQKIVVTHNGRITVAGGPGAGASFQITLPVGRRSG